MAKKVTGQIKLQITGGQATPAPPVGPALGQAGVNIMDFCKAFNARTQNQTGTIIPGRDHRLCRPQLLVHHQDTARGRLAQEGGRIDKGSAEPNREKVGRVTKAQVEEIAQTKMADLNAGSVEAAMRIIAGTARSMGIDVDRLP